MRILSKHIISIIILLGCYQAHNKNIIYPNTKKDINASNTYFSTIVADPYQWLENDRSDETEEWVKAQNKTTFNYLEKIPQRQAIINRLTEVWNYEKVSAPFKRGNKYYYYNGAVMTGSATFDGSQWYHVVTTATGSTTGLYVNGVEYDAMGPGVVWPAIGSSSNETSNLGDVQHGSHFF